MQKLANNYGNRSIAGQFVIVGWWDICLYIRPQTGGACSSRAHFASDNSIAAGQSGSSNKKSVKLDIRMVNLQTTKVRLNIVFCKSAIWFDLFVLPLIFNMQLWLVFSFVLLDRERKFHVSRIDMSAMISMMIYWEELCWISSYHVAPSGGEVVMPLLRLSMATSSLSIQLSQFAKCFCPNCTMYLSNLKPPHCTGSDVEVVISCEPLSSIARVLCAIK